MTGDGGNACARRSGFAASSLPVRRNPAAPGRELERARIEKHAVTGIPAFGMDPEIDAKTTVKPRNQKGDDLTHAILRGKYPQAPNYAGIPYVTSRQRKVNPRRDDVWNSRNGMESPSTSCVASFSGIEGSPLEQGLERQHEVEEQRPKRSVVPTGLCQARLNAQRPLSISSMEKRPRP